MTDFSTTQRLQTIFDTIFSSSFFISLSVILVLTLIMFIVNTKIKSKAPRIISVISYILLMILVLARYGNYVLSINDSIVEKFFKAMYFPNLVVYVAMLIITILLIIINFLTTKYSQITKICNIFCFSIIWFLFVLVLDVAKKESINIYEIEEIYNNSTLMILLQASMAIFCIWLGLLITNFVIRKLSDKLDEGQRKNQLKNSNLQMNDYTNYYNGQQNTYNDNNNYNSNNQYNQYSNANQNYNNFNQGNYNNSYVDYNSFDGINYNNSYMHYDSFNQNNYNNDYNSNNYDSYNNVQNSFNNEYNNYNYNNEYNNNYGYNSEYNYNNQNVVQKHKEKKQEDEIRELSDEEFWNVYRHNPDQNQNNNTTNNSNNYW